MKAGVTETTTMIVLRTDITVARYDLAETTSCSSTVYMSLLNRLTTLPIGVLHCERSGNNAIKHVSILSPTNSTSNNSRVKEGHRSLEDHI